MLLQRIIVALIILPIVCLAIYLGDWPFTLCVSALMGIAAWEYWRIFKQGGFSPSAILIIFGVAALPILQAVASPEIANLALSGFILIAMTTAVILYERGQEQPASNFTINITGVIYLGWLGGSFVLLRNLPDGMWWTFLCLPASWMADTGAYLIGKTIGGHQLSPRSSPHKSWEGYLGGLPFAVAWCSGFAWLIQSQVPIITPQKGAILGLLIGLTGIIGDLFESLIKRQFRVKDSSKLLPGHGGMLDRVDATLWTGALSYILITLFFV